MPDARAVFDVELITGLARRLMACPAVAYQEEAVAAEVRRLCREHDLALRTDAHGNLHVRMSRSGAAAVPMVMVAHMDHPGFALTGRVRPGRWRARFLGGVPPAYFKTGLPLLLYPGGHPGRLARVGPRQGTCEIETLRDPDARPTMAVWDLPAVRTGGGRIRGRACDDLVGVVVLLATLIELKRRRSRAPVWGLITRAEEVGFQGALMVAANRQLPARALVVSLETSKVIPPVRMGAGVVLRGGDRASLFDSEAMRFMSAVAEAEAERRPGFTFQRAWMTGGTCEGTAFQAHGYRTAAVCVPLGNYHNCGPRERILAEEVRLHDVAAMARLLTEMGRRWRDYDKLAGTVGARLARLLAEGRARLRSE